MKEKYKVFVSVAGTVESLFENQFIKNLKEDLAICGIETKFEHDVEMCGCPNKDWLVFYTEVDLSGFDWPVFPIFFNKTRGSKPLNQYYRDLLHYGKLTMMLKSFDVGGLDVELLEKIAPSEENNYWNIK